jgi:hypothetical protein
MLTILSLFIATASAVCDTSTDLVINEFSSNPDGTDSGFEWIELYNRGAIALDLSEWSIERAKSSWSTRYTLPSGTNLNADEYLVIGDSKSGADLISATNLDFGNASSGSDAIRVVDCDAAIIDTVIYGPDNSGEGWTEDDGILSSNPADAPSSGGSGGRTTDGVDSNDSGADFIRFTVPTPGLSNATLPPDCGAEDHVVFINELLVNPAGSDSDTGAEFIELYNSSAADVDISDWRIVSATSDSSETTQHTFVSGTLIAANSYLLVSGGAYATGVTAALSLPNGTDGDAVRLLDCEDYIADSVLYGNNNDDGHLDDDGLTTTSTAQKPGDDESLARISDGYDTNQCSDDFIATLDISPDAENPVVEPIVCEPTTGVVTINEFLANPAGTDTSAEWIELYNSGVVDVSVAGWGISMENSPNGYEIDTVLPAGTVVPSLGWLVIGGELVASADVIASISMGNGTDGDGVRLYDCEDTSVDTVVYGSNNDDKMPDDDDIIAASLAPSPGDGSSLGRIEDGVDTNQSGEDFSSFSTPTPGAENSSEVIPKNCDAGGSLVINELLSNPDGDDAGYEWIEIYNSGASTVSLEGWTVAFGTNAGNIDTVDYTFIAGMTIAPGDWFLLGGDMVGGADALASISIPNGTNGDAARLVDCAGAVIDTVVYGTNNDDALPDDVNKVAKSLAPVPGTGSSIARIQDGFDTDASAVDFAQSTPPTPGTENPVIEPVVCTPANGNEVVINELLADAVSTDAGFEWVELYNNSSSAVNLDGWQITFASNGDSLTAENADVILPGNITIPAGGFLVIGDEFVEEADVVASISIGNGSGADGVRLYDCEGGSVDTLVYGELNEDELPDDNGEIIEFPVPMPDQAISIARIVDGVDTNSVEDWFTDLSPSPGETNYQEPIVVDPTESGGCGGSSPGGTAPSGCGGTEVDSTSGCMTAPLPFGGMELFPVLLATLRRREF